MYGLDISRGGVLLVRSALSTTTYGSSFSQVEIIYRWHNFRGWKPGCAQACLLYASCHRPTSQGKPRLTVSDSKYSARPTKCGTFGWAQRGSVGPCDGVLGPNAGAQRRKQMTGPVISTRAVGNAHCNPCRSRTIGHTEAVRINNRAILARVYIRSAFFPCVFKTPDAKASRSPLVSVQSYCRG